MKLLSVKRVILHNSYRNGYYWRFNFKTESGKVINRYIHAKGEKRYKKWALNQGVKHYERVEAEKREAKQKKEKAVKKKRMLQKEIYFKTAVSKKESGGLFYVRVVYPEDKQPPFLSAERLKELFSKIKGKDITFVKTEKSSGITYSDENVIKAVWGSLLEQKEKIFRNFEELERWFS